VIGGGGCSRREMRSDLEGVGGWGGKGGGGGGEGAYS